MADIIILLGNEPELVYLAQAIDKKYCSGNATVTLYNGSGITGGAVSYSNLFFVGHANALAIGDYDYKSLITHFGNYILGSKNIFLAGCSTADEVAKIIGNGFVASTLAKNVALYLQAKKISNNVYGTPGVLVLYKGELSTITSLSTGYNSQNIFVPAK